MTIFDDNDYGRNVIIFGVDKSLSFHSNNRKNNILMLGEGGTFGINGSFGVPKKRFNINFSKVNTKSCLSLCYNTDNIYLFIDRKEIFKFKC